MSDPLRVGIIGLGRRWHRRYKPALLALPRHFEIRALCDQVRYRAERAAERLGCQAVAGPAALLERDDVDVVLLLDRQWFGLWPLELACRTGKPVFCSCPLGSADRAEAVRMLVQESQLPVMVEMTPRIAPATLRLREILETQLGPARVLLCVSVMPCAKGSTSAPVPTSRGGLGEIGLVDWCVSLLGGQSPSIHTWKNQDQDFASLFLDFPDHRFAQITCYRAARERRRLELTVVAEHGTAFVTFPNRLDWKGPAGRHSHILLDHPPLGQILLEQFYHGLTTGTPLHPNLDDAFRIQTILITSGTKELIN